MRSKGYLVIAVVLAMLGLALLSSSAAMAYEPAPTDKPVDGTGLFRANNNTDLIALRDLYNWKLVSGVIQIAPPSTDRIDAQGNYTGIFIGNTTLAFKVIGWSIFNCTEANSTVANGYNPGAGIFLYNVSGPCSVVGCNVSDNPQGVRVESSSYVTMNSVTCYNSTGPGLLLVDTTYGNAQNSLFVNCTHGIDLERSNRTEVGNNTLRGGAMGRRGISLVDCSNDTVAFNRNCSSFVEQGIYVSGLRNGVIRDNTLWNDAYGLWVANGSQSVTVQGNTFTSCLVVGLSSNTTVASHDISRNTFNGTTPIAVLLGNGTSPSIRNNTFNGPSVAIRLRSVASALVRENVLATGGSGISAYGSSGLVLVLNQLQGYSQVAVDLHGCGNAIVRNQAITDCQVGIWLREACLSAQVLDNTVSGTGSLGIAVEGGSTSAVLSRNQVTGHGTGILVRDSSNLAASNNTCLGGTRGMELNGTSSPTLRENVCRNNLQAGIYLYQATTAVVSWNNCSSNSAPSGSGIVAVLGSGARFENNSLFGNAGSGMRIDGMAGPRVANNRFGGNGGQGLYLIGCSSANVLSNTFRHDTIGLRIYGGSSASVSQNQVNGAVGAGVSLEGASGASVHDNLVQDCGGYAVSATATSSSRFFLNLLLFNNGATTTYDLARRQAYDDSSSDVWNSVEGYGNYWADLTAPDADRDGIVDVPYVMAGVATDSRSLSGPLGPVTGASFHNGKSYVLLTWSASNYSAIVPATSYLVERSNATSYTSFVVPYPTMELNDTSVSPTSDYDYTITARSSLGSSVNITLAVISVDAIPPQVHFISPSYGSALNFTSLAANWTGSDQGTGIVLYEISRDGGAWQGLGMATSVSLPALPQGWHELTVRAWDAAGNNGTNRTRFYVDNFAPSLSMASPLPGAFLNSTSVQARWVASDNGTGIKGYQYRLDLDGWSPLQPQNTSLLSVLPGAHTLYVRAFDNTSLLTAVSLAFTVDPYPPVVTITSPSQEVVGSTSVHLAWTGEDNLTAVVSYQVRVDNASWTSVGLDLSLDLSLSEGVHYLEVRALDQAGNYGGAARQVTVDLTSPVIYFTRPLNGTYVNQPAVLIEWNVTPSLSPIAWFELRLDGAASWTNVSTALSYQTPALAEGLHVVEVRAWDLAGNSGINSTSFYVDSAAPVVEWLFPPYGKLFNVTYAQMMWNVSDGGSGLNTTFVLLDSLVLGEIGLDNNYTVTNLSHGAHMVGISVYDLAGNRRNYTVGIYVDLVPPTLNITYPAEGQIIQARDVMVLWSGSDVGVGVSHYDGRSDIHGWVDFQASTSHVFTGFSDGHHTVYIKVYDHAGNWFTRAVNFTVDFSTPVVALLYPSSSGWVNSTSFVARWTGSDSPLGMAYYEVRVDGGEWHNTGLSTSYAFEGLNMSQHLLELKGVSNTSQVVLINRTFGIDLVAPTAPTVIEPSRYVSDRRISITWGRAEDDVSGIAGYQVRVSRTYRLSGSLVTDEGAWTDVNGALSYVTTGNPDGWYNISVRAVDGAGNQGPNSTVELVLDTEAPRALSYEPLGTTAPIAAVLVVRFSEPMVTGSVSVAMGVYGTVSWEGNTVMRFTPYFLLAYNTTYDVQVDGRDLAGNSMTPLLWQFTTIPNVGTVTGRVVDDRSAPLQGAIVSLDSGQTAATDRDGMFEIGAPTGVHTLTIRYEGYGDIQVNVSVAAGETVDLGTTSMSKAGTDFSWVIILTFVLLVAVAIELIYLQRKRRR